MEDMPRREETALDFGGALVARVITRRGPVVVVVSVFEIVEAGLMSCVLRLVAFFDGRRGSCETAADSWIAGSFLGRSWSSSPELTAFRFKLAILCRNKDEDEAEVVRDIADGPTFTFSWSACSLGKRDILTFACLERRTTTSVESEPCSHRNHVTFVTPSRASVSRPCPGQPQHQNPNHTRRSSRCVTAKSVRAYLSVHTGQGSLHKSCRVSPYLTRHVSRIISIPLSPCEVAAKASMDCLDKNDYKRSQCIHLFEAYKECKKTWVGTQVIWYIALLTCCVAALPEEGRPESRQRRLYTIKAFFTEQCNVSFHSSGIRTTNKSHPRLLALLPLAV